MLWKRNSLGKARRSSSPFTLALVSFRVEGAKRDAEYKLGSIVSSLRRTIGYGPRSRSPSPSMRRRPISPTKGFDSHENRASPILRRTSRSPHRRSHSADYDDEDGRAQSPGSTYVDVADVDPEQIRTVLREFVQNFITIERDRDDCIGEFRFRSFKDEKFISMRFPAEATQLRRVNKELEENLLRTEQRFSQLQKTLMSFEEGNVSPALQFDRFLTLKLQRSFSFYIFSPHDRSVRLDALAARSTSIFFVH